MNPTPIHIGPRTVGGAASCFIIAEAGVNHNGDLRLAKTLVDIAAGAGADAVKFQTFKADKLVSPAAPKAAYQKAATGETDSQLDMVKKLELPFAAFRELADHCRQRGILFLSTPFEQESADFLDELGMPAIKVPSGEITNLPFLAYLAGKGKPLIVSTGMATLAEVETAVQTIRRAGNEQVALLHCVSNYPADPGDCNLRAMQTMATAFAVPVGYSDHTLGIEVSLAAVALGASIIEKHFTSDRSLPGPDHRASADPAELRALVAGIRKVEASLGHGRKEPAASEDNTALVARKSLIAACDIPAGTVVTEAHIAVMRPGTGLPPSMMPRLVGRRARAVIARGTLLAPEMFE
jgi:N-acetylneuraminate synthase